MNSRVSVVQLAMMEIEQRITKGEWKTGTRLPSQYELAKELKLSRTSLRETLTHLESRGIVNIQPGKGVFVCPPQPVPTTNHWQFDEYSLAEVLVMRQQLEGFAAASAASNACQEDIRQLEVSINDSYIAAKSGDLLQVKLCDLDFHAQIIRIASNRLLQKIIKQIRKPFELSKTPPHGSYEDMEPILEEHRQIFLAIKMSEPGLARMAMEKHLKNAALRANIKIDESI